MYAMEEGPVIPQDSPTWTLKGLNFLLWILHSKKPWWQNQEVGKELSFFLLPMSSHGKQEIILYHEESTEIITLFLFREEGRCSVRAGIMVRFGKGLVGGIYMKAIIVIHFAQKAGSNISCRTWSIFLYTTEYTVHVLSLNPHSLIIMQG